MDQIAVGAMDIDMINIRSIRPWRELAIGQENVFDVVNYYGFGRGPIVVEKNVGGPNVLEPPSEI